MVDKKKDEKDEKNEKNKKNKKNKIVQHEKMRSAPMLPPNVVA